MSETNDVLAAAAAIVDDFGHHRNSQYFAGFDTVATSMFYTLTEPLNSRAEYETLWAQWEANDGFRVHGCRSSKQKVQELGDSAAVFTHLVESDVEFGGEVSTITERETIVFEKRAGAWVAVHEHLSPESSD